MTDRSFNELDLRAMLEIATDFRPDSQNGRWIIATTHADRKWEVIVEPDSSAKLLVVVTAYPVN
ncbi:MAG: hypothetical protein ABSG31_07580 [Tepidisphaeraceae bacterium]|jgi:hypothetical protein